MKTHYFPSPAATNTLSTEQLREQFMIGGLFKVGEITAHYTDLDRMITGAALPGATALTLPDAKETGTAYFLERREIGILNLGAPGVVRVGHTDHELGHLDCLYIGQGEREVTFHNGPSGQAQFYFVSAAAHLKHPTTTVRRAEVRTDPIGDPAKANRRRINKLIHPDGVKSCELVMGFTEFEPGSVWNTMPPHTHIRRSEVYLYFGLPARGRVTHFMGNPDCIRRLTVRDREAVLSPPWSVHCGVGTTHYAFIWGMGGENQDFADIDPVDPRLIR